MSHLYINLYLILNNKRARYLVGSFVMRAACGHCRLNWPALDAIIYLTSLSMTPVEVVAVLPEQRTGRCLDGCKSWLFNRAWSDCSIRLFFCMPKPRDWSRAAAAEYKSVLLFFLRAERKSIISSLSVPSWNL